MHNNFICFLLISPRPFRDSILNATKMIFFLFAPFREKDFIPNKNVLLCPGLIIQSDRVGRLIMKKKEEKKNVSRLHLIELQSNVPRMCISPSSSFVGWGCVRVFLECQSSCWICRAWRRAMFLCRRKKNHFRLLDGLIHGIIWRELIFLAHLLLLFLYAVHLSPIGWSHVPIIVL